MKFHFLPIVDVFIVLAHNVTNISCGVGYILCIAIIYSVIIVSIIVSINKIT